MKKLLVSASVAAAFSLAGCGGGDSIDEVRADTPKERPASRIVYDPSGGKLQTPTDLLFALVEQTDDGTLEVPDEIAAQANGGTPDFGNPSVALGAIDGWSTQHPFSIEISHPTGITLDEASAGAPGAVRIFEGAFGGNLDDADCATVSPLAGCKIYSELTFGVDFITKANGDDIAVIPLKPLKNSGQYYVVVTKNLKASDGQSVLGSSTFDLLKADINTLPLATDSQLLLQSLTNSFMAVVTEQGGVNADDITFINTFTTQSGERILDTIKKLQVGTFAQAVAQGMPVETAAQFLPALSVNEATMDNAFDVLAPTLLGADYESLQAVGLDNCAGIIAAVTNPSSPLNATAAGLIGQVGAFCAADLKAGSISLPYYLSTTEPLSTRWKAACTNGLIMNSLGEEQISQLIQDGVISEGPLDEMCQAATAGQAIQLKDLDLTNLQINDLRHVTRYSPIPAMQGTNPDGTQTLDVQITVPNETIIATLAALPGSSVSAITKPASGWPVVILQHGITSKKEDMLAITGALSVAGFATVAIDHPLHGSRGFTIDGEVVNASSGFGGATTDYMNLGSLLTTRDNLRQSIVDGMGLRLGLNAVLDLTGGSVDLDEANVSFLGHSLGSISGIGTVAMSNKSMGGDLAPLDGMYTFKNATFSVPGGGIAGFLVESPSFGSLIKGSLLAKASPDFQAFLAQFAAQTQTPVEDAIPDAFDAFIQMVPEESLAEINATFASFVFAAQTITDAADPNNFAASVVSTTPVLVHEVVGGGTNDDGSVAMPDQVIPNTTENYMSFAGTEPLIRFMGLSPIVSTTQGESVTGAVRFISGEHSSLLRPTASAAATTEMQTQVANYFGSGAQAVVVTNESVVKN
ncbi:hypothetical protein OE749_11635 [Aestuariibacter sp. AA17]|uniref:Bacterial virulence factor lipase N-terminal domain-containing protein n=1 Tax=Fluctibacter corallii TaxID=2984329 RepID=A0ABT3A9I5_9ALTE|nr:VolA/Pla-1 family phospholipase [Aestuariibacter sp. AA17]MCV2885345.1 hypothetical protein [Aestuariibacter sp. AA17]